MLRDLAANSAALQTYSALLPVEGILLDTLGDEGSIMFADARRGMKPMSAAEIGLTLDLAHRPLVFSHIAFSWLSVGAAFMSAGARGYVGTLWSVESEPAHEMALRELGIAEQNGVVDDMTRRSYVHLGLVGPRRAEPAAGQAPLPRTSCRMRRRGRRCWAPCSTWPRPGSTSNRSRCSVTGRPWARRTWRPPGTTR